MTAEMEDNIEACDSPDEEMPAGQPNILCILMDQLRWDHLGCFGNRIVRTPNLDRLAKQGVVFERAYVSNPLCMPARATLWTGLPPRQHGVRTNGIPLAEDIPTLAGALQSAGYHTHLVGKLHLSNFSAAPEAGQAEPDLTRWPESRQAWHSGTVKHLPENYYGLQSSCLVNGHASGVWGDYLNWLRDEHPDMIDKLTGQEKLADWTEACGGDHAFQSALPEEFHYNRFIADRTCDFLQARAEDKNPFFCWTSFPDPHHSFVAPRPYCDWYNPQTIPLPPRREGEFDTLPPFYRVIHEDGPACWGGVSGRLQATRKSDDEIRHIIAMTYAMVSCVDAAVGRILDALEQSGLAENTVVCFLTDHGDMLGDHGIVNKGPFHFEGLLRMPMIWSCPGRFPEGIRTRGLASQLDFAPTVLDLCGVPVPEGPHPESPIASHQRDAWPGRSLSPVLKGQEKKVRDWVIVENDEDYLGVNLRTFITNRYKITVYAGREEWGELFDLQQDPDELDNLWHKPECKSLRQQLLAKFLYCYLEEEAPLPRRMTHA